MAKEKPLTALQLADALDCFWNAAISEMRTQSYHGETPSGAVNAIVAGVAAVAQRLRETSSK